MRGTGFTTDDAIRLYRIDRWGEGYFDVDPGGALSVINPDSGQHLALAEIVAGARAQGLRLPMLLRFGHILAHRVQALQAAFDTALREAGLSARYTPVYPIKVNQQASVVRDILAGGEIGLEAGSKPELLAVLGLLPRGRPVICNGYKDAEYIRLALHGAALGHRVTLVVEKLSELSLIAREAHEVTPQLGLRVRLSSISKGHWQNTGGEKAKFGLSSGQLLEAVETLRRQDQLECLHLLHFHVGSQVANLRDMRHGLREAARIYVALRELGAPIDTIDVGGGLAVDYEGTRSRSSCSMNYDIADYARAVVGEFAETAAAAGHPCPDIISESGRALSAHHAVLVTNVIDHEPALAEPPRAPEASAPPAIRALWALLEDRTLPPLERLEEAASTLEQIQQNFSLGELSLAQRAAAEQIERAIGAQVLAELDPQVRAHRDSLDALQERFADKYFCNFSLFQSLPDVWAIDQVFPIVPLERLDSRPGRRAVIQDLTCDSDGRIDQYVDRHGLEPSLPVHAYQPGDDYQLGIFLVGAYQEILGDMHNLFGDTDAANVALAADGSWQLEGIDHGDRVAELLEYVHLEPARLRAAYREKLAASALDEAAQARVLAALDAGLEAYTYLA